MRFSETLNTVDLILEAKDVPLIIGEAGIGKTALVKELSKRTNSHLVTIDANLLKEGEIGGLPIVENRKTVYAIHNKLAEVEKLAGLEDDKNVILFIDELNRCEHAVQQELMNLILNREINGYYLADKVRVITAMNPSNKYESFESSDYQVVDMDAAQEDRFVWVEMDADVKEWIRWGMGQGDKVHGNIIEFISTFPEYLHTPYSRESIKATPRSWERVSKAYKVYNDNKDKFSIDIFYNVVKGNVGVSIATDFMNFIKNIKNPLIKAEELFSYEVLGVELKERIKRESQSRLYIMAKNSLSFLEKNINEKNINIFANILMNYPKDLRLGIMKEIKSDYSTELYKKLLEADTFLDAFFSIYE
ncbi:AAA family ATPase [Clostridium gasigenes]|uniref:AAA family ATPase n=1 Tax=Clostridium gasigenes TaxID=94869 RepID=UPI0014384CBA|nr:AAA family ATPase [Clostridium gasigenes]MBU3133218.1 AAA family ATPase [Clostridium gasigenes]NKF07489.1 AAA family ATPase [Clostridium gasigenes]QSW21434.1 AAA family ATPase [Clostridium gasigenes]